MLLLVLCFCAWSVKGAPSSPENCLQVSLRVNSPVRQLSPGKVLHETHGTSDSVELQLTNHEGEDYVAVQKYCSGSIGNLSIKVGLCAEDSPCLIATSRHSDLVEHLHKARRHTVQYTCVDEHQTLCLNIIVSLADESSSVRRIKRATAVDVVDPDTNKPALPTWALIGIGAIIGITLLTIAVGLCVKSDPNEVNLTQQSGLKIIDGPPREYIESRQKSNSIVITEHHNATNNTMTQEARMKLEQPASPISTEDRPITNSPPTVEQGTPTKLKKTQQDPLPLPPTESANDNVQKENDDEEEENPYDLADPIDTQKPVNVGGNEDGDHIDGSGPSAAKGSYAKVSRHSGVPIDPTSSYAEVTEVRNVGRGRSSTEPVEPPPPLPPITKHRTMSGNENSHLPPLPHPPSTGNSDKPFNASSDHLASLKDEEKVYDSLDDDENEEMYESVPEDLKEELIGTNQSVPLPPRSPKGVDSMSGSPSPTKHPTMDRVCPDSPTSKKVFKKSVKKTKSTQQTESEDPHKSKISLLNRFRSSSTSTGSAKSKSKDKPHPLNSPDHTHLSHPIPPPPMMHEEDDDNDMYDSVDQAQILDIKSRAATLPASGARASMLFNPRATEPLPEVPEDSGSGGSKGGRVKRERCVENDDPNYDVVSKPIQRGNTGDEQNEDVIDDDEEDPYDTVKPRGESITVVDPPPLPPTGHSYAKVTAGPNSMTKEGSVDHDDKGYAVVDPNIVLRKRAASLTKQKSEDRKNQERSSSIDEPPYDRVQKDDEIDEPPYDRVKKDDEVDEPPYDRVRKDDEIDEPPYDRVKKDDEIDEPPYDRVKKDNEIDEPPYDRVKHDDESPYDKVGDKNETEETVSSSTVNTAPGANVDDIPINAPADSKDINNPPSVFVFTTETVSVQDDSTYSHVDLAKKYRQRQRKKEQQSEAPTEEGDRSSTTATPTVLQITEQERSEGATSQSPPPVISPVCDLGDDLSPPSVPSPVVDSPRTDSPNDPDYDVVGPEVKKTLVTDQTTQQVLHNGECNDDVVSKPSNEGTTASNSEQPSSSLPLEDSDHIYDCLESAEQQTYDTLEPQDTTPTYDTLDEALKQS